MLLHKLNIPSSGNGFVNVINAALYPFEHMLYLDESFLSCKRELLGPPQAAPPQFKT